MANGGGFLGSIRGAIFEDESKGSGPSVSQTSVSPATVQPVMATPIATPIRTFVDTSQVDPEIKASLDQAVAEANQLSYTEFVNYLEAMSSALVGQSEATVYRAALAAAAKKGFAPQEITRGIDAILQVLQSEERNFSEAASQRINDRVGTRETELADIDRLIQNNNTKMSQLQSQNNDLTSRKRTASEEIRNEKQKVEDKKRNFAATVSAENSRYQEERKKVLAYSGKGA